MKSQAIRLFILLGLFFTASLTNAQKEYQLIQDKSTLQVTGTSNVHDWEMDAGGLKCNMFVANGNENTLKITSVSFISPAKMILSGNGIMDSKTYDALKADDYPVISFKMESVRSFKENGDKFSGEIVGKLNLAGVSKLVSFRFFGTIENMALINVSGVVTLKMSDFNIEPPTAMFGALKTGNEVKLNYNFYFKKTG